MTRALLLLALALAGCEGQADRPRKLRPMMSVENNGLTPATIEAWSGGEADTFVLEPGYFTLTFYDSSRVIAQADPTTEADWPGLGTMKTVPADSGDTFHYGRDGGAALVRFPGTDCSAAWLTWTALVDTLRARYPDSLTVTNATARTLLIEQQHVVTLARPDSTYRVELGGPITITEASEYDE